MNKNKLRNIAVFRFCKKHLPNFDYEIPKDLFFLLFREISETGLMTFYRATEELKLLEISVYDQKIFIVDEKKLEEIYLKNLSSVEEKEISFFETKLLKKFKGKGAFQ